MTMHVNLSEEMEKYIKNKVASGFYGNATEVIRDAIRRMQTEENRMAAWQTAIAKGNVQLDQGEGIPYTPELIEQMTQSAIPQCTTANRLTLMFFHKSRLTLSPEAQKDFTSILRYAGERWGRAQLLIYRDNTYPPAAHEHNATCIGWEWE